jgi:hypothetical protein
VHPTAGQLAETYQMALMLLFRLLFVAYAEDRDLLRYRTNGLYETRSLKRKATELAELARKSESIANIQHGEAFDRGNSLWKEVNQLFNAINQGHSEWVFPPTTAVCSLAKALFDVLAAARLDGNLAAQVGEWAQAHAQEEKFEAALAKLPGSKMRAESRRILKAIPPLHFPIAFPEVFLRQRSGFDVILGNPPWEKAKMEENRFWSRYATGYHSLTQKQREDERTGTAANGRPASAVTRLKFNRSTSCVVF